MFEYTEELFIDPHENMHLERLISGAEGDSVCKHTHDFIELVYIESGNMVHIIDNQPYKLLQGSLLLCFPGQTHSYIALNDFGVSLINFCIKRPFAENLIRGILAQNHIAVSADDLCHAIRSIPAFQPVICMDETKQAQNHLSISAMLQAYAYKTENYKRILEEGISCLLASFFICNASSSESPENIPRKILALLESDFMVNDLSLHKIAVKLNYDSGYLNKSFKNFCGITITDYIQKKRMNMAKHLLWETDMSIDDIALFVGYDNKYFFYKLFKKLYDLTPSELRRRYKIYNQRFLEK